MNLKETAACVVALSVVLTAPGGLASSAAAQIMMNGGTSMLGLPSQSIGNAINGNVINVGEAPAPLSGGAAASLSGPLAKSLGISPTPGTISARTAVVSRTAGMTMPVKAAKRTAAAVKAVSLIAASPAVAAISEEGRNGRQGSSRQEAALEQLFIKGKSIGQNSSESVVGVSEGVAISRSMLAPSGPAGIGLAPKGVGAMTAAGSGVAATRRPGNGIFRAGAFAGIVAALGFAGWIASLLAVAHLNAVARGAGSAPASVLARAADAANNAAASGLNSAAPKRNLPTAGIIVALAVAGWIASLLAVTHPSAVARGAGSAPASVLARAGDAANNAAASGLDSGDAAKDKQAPATPGLWSRLKNAVINWRTAAISLMGGAVFGAQHLGAGTVAMVARVAIFEIVGVVAGIALGRGIASIVYPKKNSPLDFSLREDIGGLIGAFVLMMVGGCVGALLS